MQRCIKCGILGLVVAGFLGSASAVLAAPKLECSITKDGKTTTKMVDKGADCTRLGGKLVSSKPKSTVKHEAQSKKMD